MLLECKCPDPSRSDFWDLIIPVPVHSATEYKRDEEEAARVYEEFVKDFGGGRPSGTGFVRGGVIQPGSRGDASASGSRQEKKLYMPSLHGPGIAGVFGDSKEEADDEPAEAAPVPPKGSKPKRIDLFLENMKKEQMQRELRKELNLPPADDDFAERGSHDVNDPASTNLYVGNMAPTVDEQILLREFGRFGPIGSVKVMWPRDEEQRRRGRNTGFVLFMLRDDADRAREALDGAFLHEMPLNIGWGKAMPLPTAPIWPPPGGLAAVPVVPHGARDDAAQGPLGRGPRIVVHPPADERTRFVIDAVAYYVIRDGCSFEQVVMERELGNPEFAFLLDTTSAEHAYYRWRLFSLASGDSLRSWRVEPFLMVEESNAWAQRDRFEDCLRRLTMAREDICAAMMFALEMADSAAEVAEILSDALTLPETPIPLKVARLFLLSDILHNSTAPVRNASRFRVCIQPLLPDIFLGLQEAYRGADSRMGQELLRRHVLRVLRAWRGWFVFSDDFLAGLQATFLTAPTGPSELRAAHDAALAAELAALGDDDLEARCRGLGVSVAGGRADRLARLQAVLDTAADAGGWTAVEGAAADDREASAVPSAAAAGAAAEPTGRWEAAGVAAVPVSRTLQALLFMARSLAKNELSDSEAPWGLPPALLAQLEWAGRGGPDPEREDDDKDPNKKSKDYYANVGDVIRTLRDDIPCIFWKPFDYHIYRDDVVFRDPNISFRGLTNYKLVIWSLTTFGRLFFAGKEVSVVNIWQPEEGIIKMRWQVQARPRLWWLAEGVFDGISEYRLDHRGLVQEHLVTNVQLRDPPITNPLLYGLNLLMSPRLAPQPSRVPCPGSWSVGMAEEGDSPSVFGSVDA
ncbi:U2 snRNP-associated SURP motif-containing protein [Auxenochlorella protothecoides]|uniref:U2 snRNP-associated SURP motif-containing protein n=1 Tax=Auxenochlorella protothecoides TaxID=3075 RepID=A0A087SRH3_AUXPR|nr:U2 snRNP-associated SURP motif-containing protein [Auxenochlorella protothecoides]KFM28327.1 U2 snRNP-associated SURP motif-containing protein [Auxenochlorella protothecoides]